MDTYVQHLCRTAMNHLRNIADLRRCLSHDVAENLIHAFVTSRLDYSNGLLFGMSAASLRKLQHVQNTAACILTGSRKYDHITPVLRPLHWLPVEYRVQYKILLVIYKALQGQAPSYIKNLLLFHTSGRTLRSSARDDLYVPRTKLRTLGTELSQLQLQISGTPCLSLSDNHRQLQFFKQQLKAHLYRLAF